MNEDEIYNSDLDEDEKEDLLYDLRSKQSSTKPDDDEEEDNDED